MGTKLKKIKEKLTKGRGGNLMPDFQMYIVFAAIVVLFGILAYRILIIQTVSSEYYKNKVLDQITTSSTVTSARGNIYDANGQVLATSVTKYRIFIDPAVIQNTMREEKRKYELGEGEMPKKYDEIIAKGLSELLDVDYDKIYNYTQQGGSRDATIKNYVEPADAKKVVEFIEDNDLSTMIYSQAQSKRYYPNGSLASHVLGFVGNDGTGLYGLEYQYNKELAGTPGYYIIARDSYGNELPYEYESYVDAIDGYNITTTIDANIQKILEQQLATTFEENGVANRVCGIVLDVDTGAVLAMAVAPSFDLNDAWTLNDWYQSRLDSGDGTKGELQLEMWSNKCLTEPYMPGSTFKIITSAMGLDLGVVRPEDNFYCAGYLDRYGHKIHCFQTWGHGAETYAQGLQNSCNPVLMQAAERIGQDNFVNYFKLFGYFGKSGIDLPGEASTIWFENFAPVDLLVSSFGQNFKVTPINHIAALNAVANGGRLVEPYLVKTVTDSDGKTVYEHKNDTVRQIVSEEVCKTLADILEEGTIVGGAKNAYAAGYHVAAKTGTSEKIGDDKDERICSCFGFAPANDPEVCVIIIADEPQLSKYGSVVAAPYISYTMTAIMEYLGVEPDYTEEEAAKRNVTVGNYVGRTLETAKSRIEKLGLDCVVVGNGTNVVAQVPAYGTELSVENGRVIIYTDKAVKPEKDIVVPNVVGLSPEAANQVLINAGFNVCLDATVSHDVKEFVEVVWQSAVAGTKLTRGDVITIKVRYTGTDEQ